MELEGLRGGGEINKGTIRVLNAGTPPSPRSAGNAPSSGAYENVKSPPKQNKHHLNG